MPEVPYSPVPSVLPSTSVPSDYLNVQANPADFGAQVGQATERLGATLGQASDRLADAVLQRQRVINNIGSDQAYYRFQDFGTKQLFGDPNNPSTPGYLGLHGQAAVDGGQGVISAIQAQREAIKQSLANPMQQLAFDESSRRLENYMLERVGAHYQTQSFRYGLDTQNAAIEVKARDVAANYNDPEHFQHNLEDAMLAADKINTLNSASPEEAANTRFQVAQKLFTSRAEGIGNANPAAAEQFVKDNITRFDAATASSLLGKYRAGADRASVADGINHVMSGGAGGGGYVPAAGAGAGAGAPPVISQAINVTEGLGPDGQARDGIIPGTFNLYKRGAESFDNPADRAAVKERVIADLWQKAHGDPERVAVGMISGPGNIAPPGSPTPWKENRSDGRVTVAQYVDKFNEHLAALGGAGAGSPVQPAAATTTAPGPAGSTSPPVQSSHNPEVFGAEFARMEAARAEARQRFPDRPDLQHAMIEGVWQEIAQANTLQAKYEADVAKQKRDAQEAAGSRVVNQLLTDPTKFDPNELAANTDLTWEQKDHLWRVAQDHLNQVTGGREAREYGPGFWSAYQAVHASDPDKRITDPAQLWARGGPNGDLTLAGIHELTTEIMGTRTPEGQAEGQMKRAFFDAAHARISQHGLLGGKDPIGEQRFAQFMVSGLTLYENLRQAGKSPQDILGKDGPLEKLSSQYVRTQKQQWEDFQAANNPIQDDGGGTPAPAAAGTRDLTTAAGIKAAYKDGYWGYGPAAWDRAEAELRRRGLMVAPGQSGPSAPTTP